ncbi:MAG: zinc finger domain-containing protein [Pyrobaculum sp.]
MSIRGAKFHGPAPPSDSTTNWVLAPLERGVTFVCPNCGRTTVVRSYRSRKLGVSYKCPECGFVGP